MQIVFSKESSVILINREKEEKPIKNESQFFYRLKQELQKQRHDVIKKLMDKDGHMMGGPEIYYIRERKWKWCIYDHLYALRLVHQDFNKGQVLLHFENWEKRGGV